MCSQMRPGRSSAGAGREVPAASGAAPGTEPLPATMRAARLALEDGASGPGGVSGQGRVSGQGSDAESSGAAGVDAAAAGGPVTARSGSGLAGRGLTYEVADFPVPTPGPGQVLVEMAYASVCGSDVHLALDGFHRPEMLDAPGHPGHEGVGRVVAVGEGAGAESTDGQASPAQLSPGTLVLAVPSGRHCRCFAEYQAIDAGSVIPLREDDDLVRVLMAQQLGCTIAALAKYWREGTRTAAVIGLGSAGQFFTQLLRARGVEVFASDVDAARIGFGRELGARAVHADELDTLVAEAHPEGVDLVIEAAGWDATRAQAVELVRVRGVVGPFGYPETWEGTFPAMTAFRKSITVEWFSNAQGEPDQWCFHEALEAIRSGTITVDHMTQVRMGLEDVPRALDVTRAHGDGAAKITITIRP